METQEDIVRSAGGMTYHQAEAKLKQLGGTVGLPLTRQEIHEPLVQQICKLPDNLKIGSWIAKEKAQDRWIQTHYREGGSYGYILRYVWFEWEPEL